MQEAPAPGTDAARGRCMFGKILCPVDSSPGSQAALVVAARLAKQNGSQLVVAHAWQFPGIAATEPIMAGRVMKVVLEDEQRELELAAEQARKLGAGHVSSKFLEGAPWQQVVELATNDREFDLIVMGTHGRTGLTRFLLGSVAEKIIRHAPISVLIVRGNPEGPYFDRVLCPIDFSKDSSRVIERAESLTNPYGSGLALLHVIELPLAASGDPRLTDFVADVDLRASHQIQQYATNRRKLPVRTDVVTGNPAEQALAILEEDRSFDLVAVGTHGRTGLERVMIGSVAEKLVRHAPCSVLVVRGPQ